MKHRKSNTLSVVLLAFLSPEIGCTDVESPTADAADRPNIVLFLADDMGWGDTAYNGNALAVTPTLDEMARTGTVLSRFYAASPVCSPTRGSILTGRHPHRFGVFYANVGHLPTEEMTLAESLRALGYSTGFFGKWHLGTLSRDVVDSNRGGRPAAHRHYSPPQWHGFDVVFATESKTPTFDPMILPVGVDRGTWWDAVTGVENQASYGTRYWNEAGEAETENLGGDDTRVIVDRVIPFIEGAIESNAPFLAVIWAHAPHLPVVASDADKRAIDTTDAYTSHYYGSIRAMDRQIARVRDVLQERGVRDNTLFWFASDNGPEWQDEFSPGTAGTLRGAKRSLYEGGIRVPSIVEWPARWRTSRQIDVPLVTTDMFPTVLDYLGVALSEQPTSDGVSVRDVLEGDADSRSDGIGFLTWSQAAYLHAEKKIVANFPEPIARVSLSGELPETLSFPSVEQLVFELYDLAADPREADDLSATNAEELERIATQFVRWYESIVADATSTDR